MTSPTRRVLWLLMVLPACFARAAGPARAQRGGEPAVVAASYAGAIRALELELAADVVRDSVGSMAAAVFVGDEVIWRGAFGWRDRDARALAGTETLYRAGSVTKTVTALVLLRLVAEGVVSLDGRVARYLPELTELAGAAGGGVGGTGAGAITFRDLAAHRSGLDREPRLRRWGRGPFAQWKRKTVGAISSTGLRSRPGSEYRYSNIGYALLGFALERAAGRPFEVLADSLVLEPLGMRSTFFVVPPGHRRRLAAGYVNLPGDTADPRVPRVEHRGRGYRVPSGGLYTTAGDLARLGMALTGALPLLPDSLRVVMLTDPGRSGHARYGLGVQLMDVGGAQLAGHSGTTPGYAAYLLVDLRLRTGVVLLRNYNNGATNPGAAAARTLLELRDSSPP